MQSSTEVVRQAGIILALLGSSQFLGACAVQGTEDRTIANYGQPITAFNARLKGSAPPVAQNLTFERLLATESEPQNWLTYYGAYNGQRFSALDQIDAQNVQQLQSVWAFQHGYIEPMPAEVTYSFEATPLVVDGVMFLTGPDGFVWALDAATGDLLWEYQRAVPLDTPLCCGNVNRGVAVGYGKVFYVTPHGRLIALDAATGNPVWDTVFVNVRAGESATLAPLIVKNLVIVGSSGGEYGVRGHLDAFEVETGRRVWRRYSIPAPGEPGSETWEGDSWMTGGGAAWVTGTYDPELNLLYWGVGNPGPVFDGSVRAGKNLYTNSVLALDPDDGSIRWHYQWTPHGVWDYDGVNENILIESGERKLLAHFDKNGYLFVLDRTDGELIQATAFAHATWGEIDRQTGEITVQRVPTAEGIEICPGPAGAKEWVHASYSPQTRLLYAPIIDMCAVFKTDDWEFLESLEYWGGGAETFGHKQEGYVKAFDPITGGEVWSWHSPYPMVGSVLSTAGNLVFVGDSEGQFNAFDARTGKLLWKYKTGSGIHGSPISYSVKGKQYVAVPSGWGGWVSGFAPELYGASRGTGLFVFALPESSIELTEAEGSKSPPADD